MTVIVFVVAAAVSLALLLLTQVYLARISRRIFNVPVLAATILLVALCAWGLIGIVGEQNALAKAQREGSDPVQVLSATRILSLRAQSDESLTLVNRGSDAQDPADFAIVAGSVRTLVGDVAALDRRTGTSGAATALAAAFAAYRAEHAQIAARETSGQIPAAIKVEVASQAHGDSPADRINLNLDRQIAAAQQRFSRSAADATSALGGLSIAIPVVTVLMAGLAIFGLRQRINEYR